MVDSNTVVTRQSWGSRLGGALKGVIVGLILFVVSFPLLFWNEGRAVRRQRALEEGAGAVVAVTPDAVDPSNNAKLVHLSGLATTDEVLADSEFGISATALHLLRDVQMFQWREESESKQEKKLGGGTETVTTYSYSRVWADRVIDSTDFNTVQGHENPSSMAFAPRRQSAGRVTLGAFGLSARLAARIDDFGELTPSAAEGETAGLPPGVQRHRSGFYYGADPSQPQVGDLRITFSAVAPTDVSIVARQDGTALGPYTTSNGGEILLLQDGRHTAAAMFQSAMTGNRVMTWALRAVGFVVMALGLSMIMAPLVVLADVIPILGSVAAAGTGVIAFLVAAVLSLITIAIAWLAYRPLLGGALLVLAVIATFLVVRKLRAAEPASGAAAG